VLSSLNIFDAIVCVALIVSAITGFNAGLMRSLAAILGYISAMPIAVAVTARLSPAFDGAAASLTTPWAQNSILFFGVFLGAGLLIGALLRIAVNDLFGPSINWADRLAGSALGVIRIGLVAVAVVVVFDRIIPADRQPGFLQGSNLRPALSRAGQQGLRSLPPDIAAYIDQLKTDRKI
jgi:membrane protein required for colicin V production